MSHVICVPQTMIPFELENGAVYYSMFTHSQREDVGSVGTGLLDDLELKGVYPSIAAWDFATFALAVGASDLAIQRSRSADGWTRVIELDVALQNPTPFIAQRQGIETMLRFLTGDFWHLKFLDGGLPRLQSTAPVQFDADCVCLLSGGMDSLVGAIDLTKLGKKPLFVSQLVKGNKEDQHHFARQLGGSDRHLLWNINVRSTVEHELSTRARSIVFYGFAAMAASALPNIDPLYVYVPENGFISLNIPLNPGRIGSHSTKTTHPVFLKQLQNLWDGLGIKAKLHTPYKYLTKGEVLLGCQDKTFMDQLMPRTTSCGKYGRLNTQCGRCLPCLVRKAAFFKAGTLDPTPSYYYDNLIDATPSGNPNDTNAVAIAYLGYLREGIRPLAAGALSFATSDERAAYQRVVEAGISELGTYLRHQGVI
jgi:Queuosine biosynthesis protein QueC